MTLRPELAALQIADPPAAWAALGFTVSDDGVLVVGGVELWLDAAGRGITGWTLRGLARRDDVDGLPTGLTTDPPPPDVTHPNGAVGIDQVVVTTSDFDRTAAALETASMPLRRVVDAGGFRQGFRRLGPAIMEIVEVPDLEGTARFTRQWARRDAVGGGIFLDEIMCELADVGRPLAQRRNFQIDHVEAE